MPHAHHAAAQALKPLSRRWLDGLPSGNTPEPAVLADSGGGECPRRRVDPTSGQVGALSLSSFVHDLGDEKHELTRRLVRR